MRCVAVALVVVAMVFGVAAMAQTPVPPQQPVPPQLFLVAGQLTKIDGKALTITTTVAGKAKVTLLTCNDATYFLRVDVNTEQVKFEDLKVGQPLQAYYTDNFAKAIIIAEVAQPAASPAHAAPVKNLDALLDEPLKAMHLARNTTVKDLMEIMKQMRSDFKYQIDPDPALNLADFNLLPAELNLKNTSFRAVLKAALLPQKLDFTISNGVIFISSPEGCAKRRRDTPR